MSWFTKNCKITVKTSAPECAAVTLGIGGTHTQCPHGQCISFDINMNKECIDFKEDIKHQRQMLVDEFKKHIDLLYNLIIYAETKHYTADKSTNPITYHYKGESKIHWHGMLILSSKMCRKAYTKLLNKIRDRFTTKSQTNKHRAMFYKVVRDNNHKQMRLHYMRKQNLPNPITFNFKL